MLRLKNRNFAIPNGLVFKQPETGFQPPVWTSFEAQVQAVMRYRLANPALCARFGWSTDYETVVAEVELQLATLCRDKGWTKFIVDPTGDSPMWNAPFKKKQWTSGLVAVAEGAKTLVEWIKTGAEAVPAEQAARRAATCANCPRNGQGGLEAFFTRPVSEVIRRELGRRDMMRLSTPDDPVLNVCEVCYCPIKLMVHVPLEMKLKHMPEDIKAGLPPFCWVLSEEAACLNASSSSV